MEIYGEFGTCVLFVFNISVRVRVTVSCSLVLSCDVSSHLINIMEMEGILRTPNRENR